MWEIDFSRPVYQFWPENRGASKNPPVGSNRNRRAQKVRDQMCDQTLAEVENECVRSIFWYRTVPYRTTKYFFRGRFLRPHKTVCTIGHQLFVPYCPV